MLETQSCLSQILTGREKDDRYNYLSGADIYCYLVSPVWGSSSDLSIWMQTKYHGQTQLCSTCRYIVFWFNGQYFTRIKKENKYFLL